MWFNCICCPSVVLLQTLMILTGGRTRAFTISSRCCCVRHRAASLSIAPVRPGQSWQLHRTTHHLDATGANMDSIIDWACDHGRGEEHLSFELDAGDVVCYQTGTWRVDGVVVVGDDTELPQFEYAVVDTLQIVWTHNCEHGVIRGRAAAVVAVVAVVPATNTTATAEKTDPDGATLVTTDDPVELAPDQLVARLRLEAWTSSDGMKQGYRLPPYISNEFWRQRQL